MPTLKWTDADEIGHLLHEAQPRTDPLSVRFADLREMVLGLEGFAGDPAASTESVLEAIQMAWLESASEDQ